jgi:hypothetical protein
MSDGRSGGCLPPEVPAEEPDCPCSPARTRATKPCYDPCYGFEEDDDDEDDDDIDDCGSRRSHRSFDLDDVMKRTKERVKRLELISEDGPRGDDVYRFLRKGRRQGRGYVPQDSSSDGSKSPSLSSEMHELPPEVEPRKRRGRRGKVCPENGEADLGLYGSVRWVRRGEIGTPVY